VAAAAAAADWLSKRGPTRRQSAGAKIAEQYFRPAATAAGGDSAKEIKAISTSAATSSTSGAHANGNPAGKRRNGQELAQRFPGFSVELLAKAPAQLQTCRSLLLFLEKKLDEKVPEAPAVKGPEALRTKLERHAALAGRLASLVEKAGWDARAKRVLDLAATAQSVAGQAAVTAAQNKLSVSEAELRKELGDQSETDVEALVTDRKVWEKAKLRRDWLSWCAKLLQAREAGLLAEAEGRPAETGAAGAKKLLGAAEVLQALLSGEMQLGGQAAARVTG